MVFCDKDSVGVCPLLRCQSFKYRSVCLGPAFRNWLRVARRRFVLRLEICLVVSGRPSVLRAGCLLSAVRFIRRRGDSGRLQRV